VIPSFRERVAGGLLRLHDGMCSDLEVAEREAGGTETFRADRWEREGGGGGTTRVLQGGVLLEKCGVAFSRVHGLVPAALRERLPGDGPRFHAMGVSLVLHPRSPHVPAVHANFRYVERGRRRWFGGGADLTPCYLVPDDVAHFHGVWERVCRAHAIVADHARMRDDCDRYFWLPHRGERRGVGGIFFDQMQVDDADETRREAAHAFVEDAGEAVMEAWLPIARRRAATPVTDAQRVWQEVRRGRYVEFNLLYDRGTAFGLQTGGRAESILMSLPPRVRWAYAVEPKAGTPERALLDALRRPPPAGGREATGAT
jgi:coproporphyrinogen III oxidase